MPDVRDMRLTVELIASLKAARQLDVDVDSFQDEPDEDDRLKVYSFTPSGRVVEADPSSMDVDFRAGF